MRCAAYGEKLRRQPGAAMCPVPTLHWTMRLAGKETHDKTGSIAAPHEADPRGMNGLKI